ncbi:MAG: glycosyltransferase family 87 protein [Microthrixaceae bacterium]
MSTTRSELLAAQDDRQGESNPVLDALASPRAHRIAVAVALALAVALGAAILGGGGSDGPTGRLGGDYPAFYGASRMVLEGQGANLYDPAAQAAAQHDLMGATSGEFVYHPYPPFLAGLLVPLAALGYRLSFMVWVVASVGMVAWALRLLRPHVRLIDRAFLPVLVATLTFWPLLRGIIGGQNTALTMLLSVGAWWALRERRDVLAGALLAGLTYKPQFAGPLIALVVVVEVGRHRRWGILGGLAGAGAALWAIGAWVNGWDWVWSWPKAVGDYPSIVARNDAANEVSFIGVARSIWGYGSPVALAIGGLLAVACAAALAGVWWRRGAEANPLLRLDVGLLGCTLASLMLLPPHSMFYDSGLALVALWFLADRATGRHGWRGDLAHGRPSLQLVAAAWLWGLVHLLSAADVVTPLLVVCTALAILAGRVALLQRPGEATASNAVVEVTGR